MLGQLRSTGARQATARHLPRSRNRGRLQQAPDSTQLPHRESRLTRSRRKRNCKALARIARSILAAKTQVHKAVGKVAGWAAGALGASDPAQAFYEELMSRIPLPTDAKMIAAARGVQIAGILLCVMDGRNLTRCECFIDLAMAETKERVNRILVAAMSDWTGLKRFGPGST